MRPSSWALGSRSLGCRVLGSWDAFNPAVGICHGRGLSLTWRSAPGQIVAPGSPIELFPTFGHPLVVVFGHIEMDEIDPARLCGRNETQDQGRVRIGIVEMQRAPR